jgi:hypothetical protein
MRGVVERAWLAGNGHREGSARVRVLEMPRGGRRLDGCEGRHPPPRLARPQAEGMTRAVLEAGLYHRPARAGPRS